MIPVKVEKISYHPSSRSYAVILKDNSSKLFLPILVGSFEAQSIALALEVVDTPRPLTHDLICAVHGGCCCWWVQVEVAESLLRCHPIGVYLVGNHRSWTHSDNCGSRFVAGTPEAGDEAGAEAG